MLPRSPEIRRRSASRAYIHSRCCRDFVGDANHGGFDIAFRVACGFPGDGAAQSRAPALNLFDFKWRESFLTVGLPAMLWSSQSPLQFFENVFEKAFFFQFARNRQIEDLM